MFSTLARGARLDCFARHTLPCTISTCGVLSFYPFLLRRWHVNININNWRHSAPKLLIISPHVLRFLIYVWNNPVFSGVSTIFHRASECGGIGRPIETVYYWKRTIIVIKRTSQMRTKPLCKSKIDQNGKVQELFHFGVISGEVGFEDIPGISSYILVEVREESV